MADERFVLIEARPTMAAEMLATTPEASTVAEERFVETVAASARTVERSTVVEARAEVPSTAIAEVVSETVDTVVEALRVATDWLAVAVEMEPLTGVSVPSTVVIDSWVESDVALVDSEDAVEVVVSCSVDIVCWPVDAPVMPVEAETSAADMSACVDSTVDIWVEADVPCSVRVLKIVDTLTACDVAVESWLTAAEVACTVVVLSTVERLRLADAVVDWLTVAVDSDPDMLVQALTALETFAELDVAVSVESALDRPAARLVVFDTAAETVETSVLSVVCPARSAETLLLSTRPPDVTVDRLVLSTT